MSDFLRITQQPNFPQEDLSEGNAATLAFTLRESGGTGNKGYQDHLLDCLPPVYAIGASALQSLGYAEALPVDPASPQYRAFVGGFADFDAIFQTVNPLGIATNGPTDRENMQFFLANGDRVWETMAQKYKAFSNNYPATHQTLIKSAPMKNGQTLPVSTRLASLQEFVGMRKSHRLPVMPAQELHLRLMGACTGFMLAEKHEVPDDARSLFVIP